MQRKYRKKGRQPWQEPYRRLLVEISIILVIWAVAQGDPHHTIESLVRLLANFS